MGRFSPEAVRAFGGRVAIALVLSTLLTTAAVAGVNNQINSRLHRIRRIHLLVAKPPPEGENFLVIGSDSRQFVDTPEDRAAFGPNSGGKNSDTLMVAHVEPGAQRTQVVSFPRDLMVQVPGLPGRNRINAAYGTGGPQLVIDMLKRDFDIDIHHYVEVDFKSFADIVDAIGKVNLYMPGRLRDAETGFEVPKAGCYALDGGKALAYVRSRNMQIADPTGPIVDPDTGEHWRLLDVRADLDRVSRQQQFMRKLASVAISRSLSDPFTALVVADILLGDIKADQSLSRDDVNALIDAFRTVDVNDPNSVNFVTIPTAPDPANPNVTLVLGDGAQETIDGLRTFGNETPPTASVLPAQVRVEVRDGSGKNIAQDTLTKLVQLGFQSAGYGPWKESAIFSEIHYDPNHVPLAAAKAVLAYVPGASVVKDSTAGNHVILLLGATFPGLTVEPTATTLPASPVDTAPPLADTKPPRTAPTTTTVPPSQQCG